MICQLWELRIFKDIILILWRKMDVGKKKPLLKEVKQGAGAKNN